MTSSPKPSRKLLAIAGALSVVAGSFATVPATFAANVSASVPGGNSQNSAEECRHIAVSATQYQGLPGQYQRHTRQQPPPSTLPSPPAARRF